MFRPIRDDASNAAVALEALKLDRFADELDLTQVRIDQATEFAVAQIRRQTTQGEGRRACLDCGDAIPLQRQRHVPNAIRCIGCQDLYERRRMGSLRC